MFSGSNPCKMSGSLSFQESTVVWLTSPASPAIDLALIPLLFLKRSSLPLDALNSGGAASNAFALCKAFSCSIVPDIGIFLLLALRNHYSNALSISAFFPPLDRFVSLLALASKADTISSLFSKIP